MLCSGPLLVSVVVLLSSEASAYPGQFGTGSIPSTNSTSTKKGPSHVVKTVYETTCNQTSTSSSSFASPRISSSSSCDGKCITVSSGEDGAPFPSHAQSATIYQSSDHDFPSTRSINDISSSSSRAQSASSSSTSAQNSNLGSSARQTTSQSSTGRNSSSASSSYNSDSNFRPRSSTLKTSQTTSSEPSTFRTQSILSSSPNATSSLSSSVPSGYALVQLSTSSSTESVSSGLSALSSTTTTLSPTIQTSSTTKSISASGTSMLRSSSLSPSSGLPSTLLSSSSSYSTTNQNIPNQSSLSTTQTPLSAPSNQTSGSNASAPTASAIVSSSVLSGSALVAAMAAIKSSSLNPSAASSASKASRASLLSASRMAASETAAAANCNDGSWDLTIANYKKANTDANLKTWWHGGTDNETGITFPAKSAPGTFLSEALGASFEPVGSQFVCTLEAHSCQPADGCASRLLVSLSHTESLLIIRIDYAVHIPQGVTQLGPASFFKEVGPASHYGWFAIHSIANIFSFSESFTVCLFSHAISKEASTDHSAGRSHFCRYTGSL